MALPSLSVVLVILATIFSQLTAALPQLPLQRTFLAGNDGRAANTVTPFGKVNLIKQDESICDAGSAQWTGLIPVGDDRKLFFWCFESRHEPQNDPLVIWVNGGPGASSLLGAFYENGPCLVNEEGTKTERNPHSWTNFANMLYIDQPVGVGFSKPAHEDQWAKNIRESAMDFDKLLDTFLDLFPDLQGRPIHFSGESFGGKYVPTYTSMMRRKMDSIILVDPLIDFSQVILGIYDHFCLPASETSSADDGPPRYMNATSCAEMEKHYAACDKFGQLCSTTYDGDFCMTAALKCLDMYEVYLREVVPGGRNPYDERLTCKTPPICGQLGMEQVEAYLNLDRVQSALGFEEHLDFQVVNIELNQKWANTSEAFIPSSRELKIVLDEKDTPVLFLNGNHDITTNTEGLTRILNNLHWSGEAGFRKEEMKPWHFQNADGEEAKGGMFKMRGNLALFTVDGAGHESPHDQPEAISQVMEKWVNGNLGIDVYEGKQELSHWIS